MWRVLASCIRSRQPVCAFRFSTVFNHASLKDIQEELTKMQSPEAISDILQNFISNSQAIAKNTDKHQIIKFLDFLERRKLDSKLYAIIPELLDHTNLEKLTHNEIVYITWKLSLKSKELRNTHIFYQLEKTLENTLASYPPASYKNILGNFVGLPKDRWKLSSVNFANAIMEGLHKHGKYILREPKIMFYLGKLAKEFQELGVDMERNILTFFKGHISKSDLDNMSPKALSMIGNGISQIFTVFEVKPRIPLSDRTEFFDVWSKIILDRINQNIMDIDEITTSLRPFVILDKGEEDFLTKLEEIVFPQLTSLPFSTFNSLFVVYHKRIKFDHQYMINYILGAMTKDVVRRNQSIPIEYFPGILVRLGVCSRDYGIYCDKETLDFLTDKIYDPWVNKTTPQFKCKYYTTLLAFLTQAAYELDIRTFKDIDNLYTQYMRYDDIEGTANYAMHAIRKQLLDSKFWDVYAERWGEIRQNDFNFTKNYMTLTGIKLLNPELYARLEEEYEIEKDRLRLQEMYGKHHTSGVFKQAFFQNKIEDIFSSKGIHYESEYFDELFIDIALPEQKLAFELNGPLHYVLPGSYLNGKTEFRALLLRKLGWRVVHVPFRSVKLDKFDEQLFSILKSYMVHIPNN
jgi:hypothetical protein